jgi:hypothetical protein
VLRLGNRCAIRSRLIRGVRHVKTVRPQTAKELWVLLTKIFPGFSADCEEIEIESDTTLHFVMMDFTPYFSGKLETFSENQLKKLALFINDAVSVDDNLENAVGTCFLEHLHQVCSYKALAPFLSRQAKDKTHA